MPITSSAKKAMRQSNARLERRKPFKSRLKTELKKFIALAKTDTEQAKKLLPQTQATIDIALKKNIIHKNNAARKKARLARLIGKPGQEKKEPVEKKAKSSKAKK
jgi:small subunit ribosomal protein S20